MIGCLFFGHLLSENIIIEKALFFNFLGFLSKMSDIANYFTLFLLKCSIDFTCLSDPNNSDQNFVYIFNKLGG